MTEPPAGPDGRPDDLLGWSVRLSLMAKALLGLAQMAAGLALWIAPTGAVGTLAQRLTRRELLEDPADPLARAVLTWTSRFDAAAERAYLAYLFGHGLLHLAVVMALLLQVRGGYHLSLAALWLFVLSQAWALGRHFDPVLLLLTLLDLIVIALVVLDHRRAS